MEARILRELGQRVPDSNKPSIDQRLEALVHSAELHHLDIAELTRRVDQLTQTSERHEREQQRFRRAMRAGLEAWLNESEG